MTRTDNSPKGDTQTASTHTRRHSASLTAKAMTHSLEWPSLNKMCAGGNEEKQEPLSINGGGRVKWCSHCGNQYGSFSKN